MAACGNSGVSHSFQTQMNSRKQLKTVRCHQAMTVLFSMISKNINVKHICNPVFCSVSYKNFILLRHKAFLL